MKQNFREEVYRIASKIPRGKVTTYGQLASLAGHPGAARAVGGFMRTNPDLSIVPCHRVVASNGRLTGYSAGDGIPTKKKMLIKEGVKFTSVDRVDLLSSLWKPKALTS